MRILVTGASGFVGSSVIDRLISAGHEAVALRSRRPVDPRATEVRADLFDVDSLAKAMAGCGGVIHLVGIISEDKSRGVTFERMHVDATRTVVEACAKANVRRLVHMSAICAREDAPAEYHRTKARAEAIVKGSSLDWTIIRPSLIHGPRGEFVQMLAAWARMKKAPFLFMPYFGRGVLGLGGAGKLQPVFVDDVARLFVDALTTPASIWQIYEIGGPDVMTWPELHAIASRAFVGRKRLTVPIPAWWARILTSVVPEKLLGTNRDQVEMSQEDNVADMTAFCRDFGFPLSGFEETLHGYAGRVDE
jgi:NADH dehydrogenase